MESSVLIISSTGDASGVVSYVSALARAVSPAAYVIAVPPGSDLESTLPPDARTLTMHGDRRGMTDVLAKYKHRFPVLQTHGARAISAARLARVPAGSINHVFHEFPRARYRRSWVELASAVKVRRTANTPALAHWLARARLPVSEVLTPLLPAHDFLSREQARAQLGLPGNALAAVVVGRLHQAKCPTLAVDAVAAALPGLDGRLRLFFLGDGPLRRAVEDRARERQVGATVRPGLANAWSVLAGFDVVIVPSRHETFCIGLAEAALARVPIAAVDSPGSRLLSVDGCLLPLAQPTAEALGREILSALHRPASAREEFHQHVWAKYGVESGRRAYEQHFRALLTRRRS